MASVIVILLSLMLASGFNPNKRCLLFNRTCVAHCPKLMHAYHTRCDKDTISQRTCENPFTYALGYTCGWSRCDCNGDLFLDEETYLCLEIDACPVIRHRKPENLHGRRNQKNPHRRRQRKKIIIPEDKDTLDVTNHKK